MWTRIGIAAVLAVLLALPISVGLATANPSPIGKADFTSTSGISGVAIVRRQLTLGETQVQLRVSGLSVGQIVKWQIVEGAWCGSTPTSTLMTKVGSSTANRVGIVSSTESQAVTLNVTSGTAMMTFRVYDYTFGKLGPVLACAQIIDQPNLGSQHWW